MTSDDAKQMLAAVEKLQADLAAVTLSYGKALTTLVGTFQSTAFGPPPTPPAAPTVPGAVQGAASGPKA